MVNKSDWQEMKRHAFEAFASNGWVSVQELEEIVEFGCAGAGFDEHEKIVLINIISKLTRADLNDTMWAKVDELIHKLELHHDSEASVEPLVEQNDLQGDEL